ncbi:MAG: hypothetical protein R2810_03685 [Flavobacteriales bacterium]
MKYLLLSCSSSIPAASFAQEPAAQVASAVSWACAVWQDQPGRPRAAFVNANYEYKVGPNTSVGLLAGYKVESTFTLNAIGNIDGE